MFALFRHRLWSLLALFALFCAATTPATAMACACEVHASIELVETANDAAPCHNEICHEPVELKTGQTDSHSPEKPCVCTSHESAPFLGSQFAAFQPQLAVSVLALPVSPLKVGDRLERTVVYRPFAQSPPGLVTYQASPGRAPPASVI